MADIDGDLLDVGAMEAYGDVKPSAGSVLETGSATPCFTFLMRARDTTLARPVYWTATILDTAGSEYTGPGPLTDVVLSKKIGS